MKNLILLALLIAGPLNAECFIDGAFTPRCYEFQTLPNGSRIPPNNQSPYLGVSWPVFTAETPAEVWHESTRRSEHDLGTLNVPYASMENMRLNVKHVRIDSPDRYPDVICLDFFVQDRRCIENGKFNPNIGGDDFDCGNMPRKKSGQVCFDTMEITER